VVVTTAPPTLTLPGPQTIDEGAALILPTLGTFSDPGFDNSKNPNGPSFETFTYFVNWGDGTAVDTGTVNYLPGSPGKPSTGSFGGGHTFADNGTYTVTVTIIDDNAGTVTKTFSVDVTNVAPTVTVAADQTVDEGQLLSFGTLAGLTDPGFDNPLRPGQASQESFTYSVNWGDGTTPDTGSVGYTAGSVGVLTTGNIPGSHTYADNGVYTVTVTVTDDDGAATSKSFTVTVGNITPTLNIVGDQTINEGAVLSFANLGGVTDPGFDNPNRPGNASVEAFTYTVNWGDGTNPDAGTVNYVPGSPGVLTVGSFGGSHTYADNGVYTVTVTVTDDDGAATSQDLPGDCQQRDTDADRRRKSDDQRRATPDRREPGELQRSGVR
jgi:large repetitive protein